jgi:hypothetical protein
VDVDRPIAGLDNTIEEEAVVDTLDILEAGSPHAGMRWRLWPGPEPWKNLVANLFSEAIFLSDCFLNFCLQAFIEGGEIFPRLPRVEVQRLVKRLAKGCRKFIRIN